MYNGNLMLTVKVADAEEVPDSITVQLEPYEEFGEELSFDLQLIVIGLKPRCHKCKERGRLARDCVACTHCGSLDHRTIEHGNAVHVSANAGFPTPW